MKPFSVGRRYEFRGMAADLPRAGQGRSRAKSGPVAEPKSAEAKGTPVITEGDIDDHFLRCSPLFLFLENIHRPRGNLGETMPRHDGSTLWTSTEIEALYCTVDAKTRGEVVAVGGRDRVVSVEASDILFHDDE